MKQCLIMNIEKHYSQKNVVNSSKYVKFFYADVKFYPIVTTVRNLDKSTAVD